ncbi:MAG: beta-hexosaminidase, partial [Rhodobacteraceae bacterium]|nr:beta-hexosaminidase [Paracoccaceae bacterium]
EDVARLGQNAERGMYLRYRLIAQELLSLGIDGNCAPLLDIMRPQTHPVLRNRCYSDDLQKVISVGHAVARAHVDAGVLPVIKHMPGHGLAQVDSHLDVPRVALDHPTLTATDFAAFRPFADFPLGMTAHLIFDQIDPMPATISSVMNAVIRQEIGFDGLLMTDDISMQALSGSVAERGKRALDAGCDLVLHCNGNLAEMVSIHVACGQLSAQGQARADAALRWRGSPSEVDIAVLEAELEALGGGGIA